MFNGTDDVRLKKYYIADDENIRIMKLTTQQSECLHRHDFIELAYIFSGGGVQIINGRQYAVGHGSLILLNIGDYHAYRAEGRMGIINCLLGPGFLLENGGAEPARAQAQDMPNIKNFTGRDMLRIDAIFEAMCEEFQQKQPGYLEILRHYVHILLAMHFRSECREDALIANRLDALMPEIFAHIRENYRRRIPLEELAGIGHYAPSYFSALFKKHMGKTITEYICEFRIAEAARLLKETSWSVGDICRLVGYNDKKRFYAGFKAIMGTTPNAYRAVAQSQAGCASRPGATTENPLTESKKRPPHG